MVLVYHESSRRLFCGCDTGLLHVNSNIFLNVSYYFIYPFFEEFLVAEDFNQVTLRCTYLGHQTRLRAVYYSSYNELLLSVCHEKKLNWYSTNPNDENHQHPRGNYMLPSWAMSLAFDELSRHCFVGDSSGNIHFLRINTDNKCQLIRTLTGHTGNCNY